jgi:PIN domain nuclease of toxin-antitoxin system
VSFLADACALLAYFGGGSVSLGPEGRAAMEGEVHVSPITVWELTNKAALGKLPRLPSENGSFAQYLRGFGFILQTFQWDDAEQAARLPRHHRDPMDRMLIATAQRAGLTIITIDSVFAAYGVSTVW